MHHGEWMVVTIVLIFAISRVLRARYDAGRPHRRRDRDAAFESQGDAEAERLRGEVRQLKDRIQVLEAIVTDGDRNRSLALEREIEALRDGRDGGGR